MKPACVACGVPAQDPPLEHYREPVFGRGFEIFRCASCGVDFTLLPEGFPLREWYAKASYLYGEEEYLMRPPAESDWRFAHFNSITRRLGLQGDLLDVGSGDGRFMELIARMGWGGSLTGLEFNPEMAARLRGPYAVEIAPLEEYARAGGKAYDVVTVFDVLEHLAEPAKSLSAIFSLLKPGGTLVVTVPNAERLRFAPRENYDFPPNHITRWSAAALEGAVRRAGFEILELRPSPFTARVVSDQLFYKLFAALMPAAKWLLFGGRARADKTLTDLYKETAPSAGSVGAALSDKRSRRKLEMYLRDGFGWMMVPILLPAYLLIPCCMPMRQGGTLFLAARRA